MRDIQDLLPQVLLYAADCPELVALRFIREAARELCHNARLWRVTDSVAIALPEGTGLTTIPDAEIVEIQAAQMTPPVDPLTPTVVPQSFPLMPVSVGWLDDNQPGWDLDPSQQTAATATWITQINPTTIRVVPPMVGTVNMRLILQPSLDALTVPDNLIDLHAVTLGKGAAGKVLMMPDVDFANPQLGLVLSSDFTSKVAGIKTEFTKGQQGARLRTKGDYF
jgi:hypothetical protein